MTPIPIKLREAIVKPRDDGSSYEEIAETFNVGYATVNRVTQTVTPRFHGGGNPSPIQGRVARLLVAIVTEVPDAFVALERDTPEHRQRRQGALRLHERLLVSASPAPGPSARGKRSQSSARFRLGEKPKLMTHAGAVDGLTFFAS